MLKEARQGSAAASKAAAETAEQESALKRFEAQRRLQPRTPADFALLHRELAAWHQAETARIKAAELSPEERHLASCHLLHQVGATHITATEPCRNLAHLSATWLHQVALAVVMSVLCPATPATLEVSSNRQKKGTAHKVPAVRHLKTAVHAFAICGVKVSSARFYCATAREQMQSLIVKLLRLCRQSRM